MEYFFCSNCHFPYPDQGIPYRCPRCRSYFDIIELPLSEELSNNNQPGIWRYQSSFGLPEGSPQISLGEGNTPLVWGEAHSRRIGFKLEFTNPTGSYKDRGSAPIVSLLCQRGVDFAVEDSSGNAGASFAYYAARAGIRARVYIPDSASGPKRKQIEISGAEVIRIMGPRSNAAEAAWKAAEQGIVYASHAFLPFGIPGYATIAFELVEQLKCAPGSVIIPVGQGNLLLGIGRGFQALNNARIIDRVPILIGVQVRSCAPIWAVFTYGSSGIAWVSEAETIAEGVRVKKPVRGDAVLAMVNKYGGSIVAVDEEEILPGRDQLVRQGLYVEPTSAIIWAGLAQVIDKIPDPVVAILTGSGLKTS